MIYRRNSRVFLFIITSFFPLFLTGCSFNFNKSIDKIILLADEGDYQEAQEMLISMPDRNINDKQQQIINLVNGYIKCMSGNYQAASDILNVVGAINDPVYQSIIESIDGRINLAGGNIHSAILHGKNALAVNQNNLSNKRKLKKSELYRILYTDQLLIDCYLKKNEPALADEYLNQCDTVSLIKMKKNPVSFFTHFNALQIKYCRLQKISEDDYDMLRNLKTTNKYWLLRAWVFAGQSLFESKEYDKAKDFLNKVVSITDNNECIARADALFSLGRIFNDTSNWAQAEESLSKSLRIYEKIRDIRGYNTTMYYLGVAQYHNAHYYDAFLSFDEIKDYFKAQDITENYVIIVNYLGTISSMLAQYKDAEIFYLEALKYSIDKTEIFDIYNNLGVVSYLQGEYKLALQYYTKLHNKITPGDSDYPKKIAVIKNNIGNIFRNQEKYNDALMYYNQGKELNHNDPLLSMRLDLNSAKCFFYNNEYTKANDILADLDNVSDESTMPGMIAEIEYLKGRIFLRKKEYESASDVLMRAYLFFNTANDIKKQAKAAYSLGIAYLNLEKNQEAAIYFKESVDLFDRIALSIVSRAAKIRFRQDYKQVVDYCISTLVDLQQYEEAWYYLEKSKARNLLEILTYNSFNIDTLIPDSLRQKRNALITVKNSIIQKYHFITPEIEKQLSQVESQLLEIERKISLEVPKAVVLEAGKVCSFEDIGDNLDSDDLLIEYALINNAVYIFLVTRSKITVEVLNKTKSFLDELLVANQSNIQIETDVVNYRKILSQLQSSDDLIRLSGKELFGELLKPVYDKAVKYSNWIVIPDGKLFYLPFAALINDNDRFLIEESFAISYAHSASVYLRQILAKNSKTTSPLLYFAVPTEDLYQFFDEVRVIEDYYPDGVCYFMEDAKESVLRSVDLMPYRTIQFFTHGFQSHPDKYLKSPGIELHPHDSEGYDGHLILPEIFNLKMNADLVILTACGSGLGKEISGEGLYGMNQAFFYAGARSVLSTLWPVYVNQTNRYSQLVHQNLSKNRSQSRDAVISAQKQLFKESSRPVYWAPFVLFGAVE